MWGCLSLGSPTGSLCCCQSHLSCNTSADQDTSQCISSLAGSLAHAVMQPCAAAAQLLAWLDSHDRPHALPPLSLSRPQVAPVPSTSPPAQAPARWPACRRTEGRLACRPDSNARGRSGRLLRSCPQQAVVATCLHHAAAAVQCSLGMQCKGGHDSRQSPGCARVVRQQAPLVPPASGAEFGGWQHTAEGIGCQSST